MSASQKEALTYWMPLVVTLFTNIALVAYGYGQLQQRISPIEKHVELSAQSYVTRQEYVQKISDRDREMSNLREDLRSINAKLDRIIEGQTSR